MGESSKEVMINGSALLSSGFRLIILSSDLNSFSLFALIPSLQVPKYLINYMSSSP